MTRTFCDKCGKEILDQIIRPLVKINNDVEFYIEVKISRRYASLDGLSEELCNKCIISAFCPAKGKINKN